jgi:hypothetical protein
VEYGGVVPAGGAVSEGAALDKTAALAAALCRDGVVCSVVERFAVGYYFVRRHRVMCYFVVRYCVVRYLVVRYIAAVRAKTIRACPDSTGLVAIGCKTSRDWTRWRRVPWRGGAR